METLLDATHAQLRWCRRCLEAHHGIPRCAEVCARNANADWRARLLLKARCAKYR